MLFFVDTADIQDIKELAATGLLDGVTTNPSLVAKVGKPLETVIAEICSIVSGSVSAEVIATDYEGMMKEGKRLASIASNVTVKLPLTWDGLKACKALTSEGISVNVTLCFSAAQALLAAKAGATYISPFIGRLDDLSFDGLALIEDICHIYSNYEFPTHILVASVRSPLHIVEAARIGADIATVPPAILKQLINHPLTEKGLATFLADWKKAGLIS